MARRCGRWCLKRRSSEIGSTKPDNVTDPSGDLRQTTNRSFIPAPVCRNVWGRPRLEGGIMKAKARGVGTPSLQKKVAALSAEVSALLEQQVATNEILRVISGSPHDVQPVFQAIAESAARLCKAEFA